jgi:methionyl aminopeptidase
MFVRDRIDEKPAEACAVFREGLAPTIPGLGFRRPRSNDLLAEDPGTGALQSVLDLRVDSPMTYDVDGLAGKPTEPTNHTGWPKPGQLADNTVSMPVTIKTSDEIAKMRVAGLLAAEVLQVVAPHVKPGVSTAELDRICHDHIVNVQKAIPANVGYRGFPATVCTSVNNVICHGIPSDAKILKDGDIVNIDVTVIKDGLHGDTSRMYLVGDVPVLAKRLVDITREALWRGIRVVKPGATLGDIGHAIQTFVEAERFSVVREYCGHGIGRIYHEDPQVLHYGRPGEGLTLKKGMTFTIEPMVNAGARHTRLMPDGWTVVTRDRSLSAQWEHTLLVTDDGVDVLTRVPGDDNVL